MIQLVNILACGVTDSTGAVLSSGTVTSYVAGTTTLKTLFRERDLESPWPNPLTLDAAGRAVAWAEDRIKLIISNSSGTVVHTIDNIGIASADIEFELTASSIAGLGVEATTDGKLDVQVDDSTIEVTADNQLSVPDDGITATQIVDDVILDGDCGVTGTFAIDGVTLSHNTAANNNGLMSSGGTNGLFFPNGATAAALDGSLGDRTLGVRRVGTANKLPIMVSAQPATHGLMLVRGRVDSAGTLTGGEGFTSARTATGKYTLTWSTAFTDSPAVAVSLISPGTYIINSTSTTTATIWTYDIAEALADSGFHFHAYAQRGAI